MFCNTGFAQCIKGDCNNGQGTYRWESGSKYVGEWKDGKTHGQGTYTWATGNSAGNKYVGEFKNGRYHGQGTELGSAFLFCTSFYLVLAQWARYGMLSGYLTYPFSALLVNTKFLKKSNNLCPGYY